MNKIKRLFLNILQNKIIYNDKIVPVVIKDYWIDMTPCITIHGYARNKGGRNRYYNTVLRPLEKANPLYDENNPSKRYQHLAEFTQHSYDIQINIWCNDEREREKIVNQVKKCLFLARNNHYTYCSRYDSENGFCKTINEQCKATLDNGYKGLRGLCPSPHEYKCCSLFKAYGVVKNSIYIGSDYEQDEYNHKPPLKRSIIDVELDYYDVTVFPSKTINCYETPQFEVGDVTDNINELIESFRENG